VAVGGVEVAHHAPVEDAGEVALEDPARLALGVSAGASVLVDRFARGSQRGCVTAMRCKTALTRRLSPGF
jgi:methyl coenzyme M reductase alpha subunit